MAPYPSKTEIKAMFERVGKRGGGFMDHVDQHATYKVMGHDHPAKGHYSTHASIADDFFGGLDWVDWSTLSIEVPQVIGGGEDPWAAVEMKTVGKSVTGKHVNHEFVCIAKFNTSGKITEIKGYFDSHHLHQHISEHKK